MRRLKALDLINPTPRASLLSGQTYLAPFEAKRAWKTVALAPGARADPAREPAEGHLQSFPTDILAAQPRGALTERESHRSRVGGGG